LGDSLGKNSSVTAKGPSLTSGFGVVLFIVLDGFLFYHYQQQKSNVLANPQSATAAPSLTTSGVHDESEQQES
jgi:hypothetical protein